MKYVRNGHIDISSYRGKTPPFIGSLTEAREISSALSHKYGAYKYAPVRLYIGKEFAGYGVCIHGQMPVSRLYVRQIIKQNGGEKNGRIKNIDAKRVQRH